jgi:hypothetical protein
MKLSTMMMCIYFIIDINFLTHQTIYFETFQKIVVVSSSTINHPFWWMGKPCMHPGAKFGLRTSISTDAQYVALHWKSWIGYTTTYLVNLMEEDYSEPEKRSQLFKSPWNSSNKHSLIVFIECCSLFLIGYIV